jgi:hypothetical protein
VAQKFDLNKTKAQTTLKPKDSQKFGRAAGGDFQQHQSANFVGQGAKSKSEQHQTLAPSRQFCWANGPK